MWVIIAALVIFTGYEAYELNRYRRLLDESRKELRRILGDIERLQNERDKYPASI